MRLRFGIVTPQVLQESVTHGCFTYGEDWFATWQAEDTAVLIVDQAIGAIGYATGAPTETPTDLQLRGLEAYQTPIKYTHYFEAADRLPISGPIWSVLERAWGTNAEWALTHLGLLEGREAESILAILADVPSNLNAVLDPPATPGPPADDDVDDDDVDEPAPVEPDSPLPAANKPAANTPLPAANEPLPAANKPAATEPKPAPSEPQPAAVEPTASPPETPAEDDTMVTTTAAPSPNGTDSDSDSGSSSDTILALIESLGRTTGCNTWLGSQGVDQIEAALSSDDRRLLADCDAAWIREGGVAATFAILSEDNLPSALLDLADRSLGPRAKPFPTYVVCPENTWPAVAKALERPTFVEIDLRTRMQFIAERRLTELMARLQGLEGHVAPTVIGTLVRRLDDAA
ncbi:MAG: hypothetical protein O6913_06365 [Chloroflexi bacterium]|nr:hypothetical protein [Chloroflexota bacterium]